MKFSSILTVATAAVLLLGAPAVAGSSHMPTCKGDTVYAVASAKTYYTKGMTQYGHAKGGHYMCMAAANSQGYHKASSSMMSTH